MMTCNSKTLTKSVTSKTTAINVAETITQGDSGAYIIEITFTDVTTIDGAAQLHFVLGDGTYADRDASDGVVLADNKITYTLDEVLYSVANLTMYVQFIDSNLYTPLKVSFSGIRLLPGSTPAASLVSYPAWVTAIASAEALRVIAESARVIAEGLRVTADGLRTTAEGNRVIAEGSRVTVEGNRVIAENARVIAESARAFLDDTYDASRTYAIGEKTPYLGSTYQCHTLSLNHLPTDTNYFTQIASKGDQGIQGIQGIAGGAITTASELPIVDAGAYYATDNAEAALQSVGASLAGKADITQEAWITPTLINSWEPFGGALSTAQYYKDTIGLVHLRGIIKSGTGPAFFILPEGYRPNKNAYTPIVSNGSFGHIVISTDGAVSGYVYSADWVSLENVVFRAEA